MDQQVSQQIEQQLRQQWDQIYPQLLERFTTVSKTDLESARTVDDLVRRISDKSRYSERLVETEIHELVTAGGGASAQSRPFSTEQQAASISQSAGFSQSGPSQGQQQGQYGQQR